MLAEIVGEYLTMSCRVARRSWCARSTKGTAARSERTAHTLRGASANVGASGLADLCAQPGGTGTGVADCRTRRDLMEQFDTELTRVRSALDDVTARV